MARSKKRVVKFLAAESLHSRMRAVADSEGITLSDLIRELIAEALPPRQATQRLQETRGTEHGA